MVLASVWQTEPSLVAPNIMSSASVISVSIRDCAVASPPTLALANVLAFVKAFLVMVF